MSTEGAVNGGSEYQYAGESALTAEQRKNTRPDIDRTNVLFQYDIENGPNKKYAKALTSDEWEKYNYAMISGVDAGLRISENAMLVECEKGEYSYKLVVYDSTFEDAPIIAVYGIGNDSYSDMTIHEVAQMISDLEESRYGKNKFARRNVNKTLQSIAQVHKILLGRYSNGNRGYINFLRSNKQSGRNIASQPDGTGVFGSDKGTVKKEFQLTEQDTEYLALAKNPEKNKSRLREMVEQTAKAAGYTERVYHGTMADKAFNVFEPGNGQYGAGTYFTYDKEAAGGYGRVMNLFVKIKKMADFEDVYSALGKTESDTNDTFAQRLGFESFNDMVDADDISEYMVSELLSRYAGYDSDTAANKAAYWKFKKHIPKSVRK